MGRISRYSIGLIAAAASLAAADPAWMAKPAGQWTEDDIQRVLAASPWVKDVRAVVTRRLTEEQLREGGQMGQPTGVGNEGVDPKGSGPSVSLNVFTGKGGNDRSPRSLPRPITLRLRWESALPIRIAEFKSHAVEAPALEGECYCIAVYGIPGGGFKGDPKELGKPLKNLAVLKRDGKRDVRPVSAEVFQLDSGVVVVYNFPLSAEISKKDGQVRFEAQIGRIVVGQSFDLNQMDFLGKLAL
jgi:hypothetical protein